MGSVLMVNGTRILTPEEVVRMRHHMRPENKRFFDGLLFTGMRNTEFLRFLDHREWFHPDRKLIRLTREAVRKKKVVNVERSVHLSTKGVMIIENIFDYPIKRAPQRSSWRDTLIHAATMAGMDTDGIEPKMLRKTLESWLMTAFPDKPLQVLLSLGHTQSVALQHYIGLGFTAREREDIKTLMEGWMSN